MEKPNIIIVGGWDELISKVAEFPIDVTLYQNEKSLTPLQSKLIKNIHIVEFDDIENILQLTSSLNSKNKFTGVISFTEYGLEPAAIIKETFGISGNPLIPVLLTRDKLKMRKKLADTNFSKIKYRECKDLEQLYLICNEFKLPLIIKPPKGAGSEGIYFINSTADIETAWEWASQVGQQPLLVEEYIDGVEFSIEK